MSKAFTPEKVRELVKKLRSHNNSFWGAIINEWLEQNQHEPVVVGLSDEQVCQLADWLNDADYEHHFKSKSSVISDWLSKQTFVQHRAFDDSKLSEKYMALYDDYQSLLVDKANTNQFEPDWSKVHAAYDKLTLDLHWHDNSENDQGGKFQTLVFERPRPIPQVEAWQVWKYKEYNYTVSSVGRVKIQGGWIESVTYKTDSGIFYTRTLEDFLAKFDRVGGDE